MRIAVVLLFLPLVVACQGSNPHDTQDIRDAAGDAAQPSLSNLTISPLELLPAFSPSIHDYYVRCSQGTNALTVSLKAASGSTVALTQPTSTAPAPSGAADVSLLEDQAIVATVAADSASSEYWVRCLPHDFPQLSMTPHPDAGATFPGYYLLGGTFYTSKDLGYAMLLDSHGTPVWYGLTGNGAGAKDIDFLEPNTISYVPIGGYTFGTYEGQFELHSLDPVGVTYVTSIGLPVDTHELRRLGNGDFLLFASPVVTGVDLTGLADFGANQDMLNCVVQEVSPAGKLVWQWTATDHFDVIKDTT